MGSKLKSVPAVSSDAIAEAGEDAKETLTTPEMELGRRLNELRIARGFTQDQLAAETGFTKGYLSKIENSKVIPPIGTLVKLARVLDTDLANLFGGNSDESRAEPIYIDRLRERQRIIRGGNSFGYDFIALADKLPHKHMEPFVMIFPPGVEKDVRFDHEGEEFMFILTGKVELTVVMESGVRVWVLSAGDSAYFDSSLPHRGRSLLGESRALVMIYRANR